MTASSDADKVLLPLQHDTPGGRWARKASGGRNSLQLRDDVIKRRKLVADTINAHLAKNGHKAR